MGSVAQRGWRWLAQSEALRSSEVRNPPKREEELSI